MSSAAKVVVALVVAAVAVALVLTGWLWFRDRGPGPESAAQPLARALASNDLSRVGFVSLPSRKAQERWDEIVDGMEDTPHQVLLGEVTEGEDGESATAVLIHRWDLGGDSWTYRTTARLRRTDEAWAVRFAPSLAESTLKDDEVLDRVPLEAERGDILGAGGSALVTERPVLRFGIDKTQVDAAGQVGSARRLARLLDVDADSLVDRVESAGEKAFVEALVLRETDVTTQISGGYEEIPGAVALSDELPLAPTREFARPVLGTVGSATAEIIEESEGRYAAGDEVGLSGLQARYDEQLAGRTGYQVAAKAPDGEARELFTVEPSDGEPLRTSIDASMQRHAEQVLADVGPAAALVALRPSDGHVLAVASGPGSDGYSTATLGRYAPGSTFKVVSSLALLREGLGPDSVVQCPARVTVDGKAFENYDDYPAGRLGRIDLRTALANSCNTTFIRERGSAAQSDLADAAASLGLGVDQDLGFEVFLGSVPGRAGETEHAASMIGQGKMLASPLAMAAVAASVAEGSTVMPTLLPDEQPEPSAAAEPLTRDEGATLRSMMRSVVAGGSASFLGDVPGPPVLAKTGTAEFGTEVPPQTHAWMIAVQGDLAVAAFVEVGESGSVTAGPLLEEFLRATD